MASGSDPQRGRLLTVRAWAAALVLAAAVLAGCGDSADTDPTTQAAEETSASTSAERPSITHLADADAEEFHESGDWLAATPGTIWLTDAASVKRLDARSGRLLSETQVADNPCLRPDVGFGGVWVATCRPGGLVLLDPGTGRIADEVKISGIPELEAADGSIATGAGGVWLVVDHGGCEDCRLIRVNPRTLEIDAEVEVDAGSAGVAVGEDSVWVTNPITDVLQQVDPDEETVVEEVVVGESPRHVVVGEGAVWTMDEAEGSVTRVDPETSEVVATVPAPDLAGGAGLAVGGGSVWVRSGNTLLARIDPATDEIAERFGPRALGGSVIVSEGAVWLSAYDKDTIWRLPLAE